MTSVYDESSMGLFDYHHSMLVDEVRTRSFLDAVARVVRPGDVVVEIGTGTGILSLAAARAGAARVYAIESERIIEVAERVAAINGFSDQIVFFPGRSVDVDLPERADVLITETIGNAAFDEGILAWVGDARARLLKPDARVIPERLQLQAALLELPTEYGDLQRLEAPVGGFDVSPLREMVINNLVWELLSPVSQVSPSEEIVSVALQDSPYELSGRGRLVARRDATVHAVGLWFEAQILDGISLTNAPGSAASSWEQAAVMLDTPLVLDTGDSVEFETQVWDGGGKWSFRVAKV